MPSLSGTPRKLSYANVMATLALFVALGGSGYAISKLPKDSVKSKQIAKNAVRSSEIANGAVGSGEVIDGSLLSGDFAAGQLPAGKDGTDGAPGPPGPTFADVENDADPVAVPDLPLLSLPVTTPAAGKLLVMLELTQLGPSPGGVTVDCSAGTPTLGLYVDDVPVPNTRVNLPDATATDQAQFGVTASAVPAGTHQVELQADCAGGTVLLGALSTNRSLGAILLGS